VIPLAEARAHVLAGCAQLPDVRVPLAEALGAVLARPVVSAELVPPFANTGMDGFAVQASDTVGASESAPVVLSVVGTVRAGMSGVDSPVGPGDAARIMTGAPIPPGADAVVMVERTRDLGDGWVSVNLEVAPGTHVRPAGDDVRVGDVVAPEGTVLTAGHLGVLATVGMTEVEVVGRPLVGVLSTGDELVADGRPLAPGQIRDSNRLSLLALLRSSGYEVVDLGLVADDEAAIEAALVQGAAACDALVTSGGVSMGDFDYVKVVLDRIGRMRWMQVAIKPAKPLAFGTIERADGRTVPVFGLPGNPVSSMVSFELFCRPGLRRMSGRADTDLDRPRVRAVLDAPFARRADGKVHFARVVCRFDESDGRYHAASAGSQGSHQLTAMAGADGLAELPDGPSLDEGATVPILLLDSALGL